MSGHSKWKTIKHKKGIADAKRGKIFTKIAKLITIATRDGGGDQDSNFKLRLAIEKARQANMPKENIKRAVERGTGKSGDATSFKEIVYEGFGPSGTAFMVETTTDNTNRTNSELRILFSKNGGNFGSSGAVGYLFDHQGYLLLGSIDRDTEDVVLKVMEYDGVVDVEESKDGIEVYTEQTKLKEVQDQIVSAGFSVEESELIYNPKTTVKIVEKGDIEKLISFTEIIEDHDDVQKVFANFEIIN